MQVPVSLSKRIVVISGGGSAASALPQAPNPPRPTAPANAASVKKRRRLCTIGMEHLPDPNGWITMSLARWPIRAVRIKGVSRAGVSPGLVAIYRPVQVRASRDVDAHMLTRKGVLTQFKDAHRWLQLKSPTV